MRVLALESGPAFSTHDVHVGWVEGLTDAGCTVANLNLNDRLTFYSAAELHRDDGVYAKAFNPEGAVRMLNKSIRGDLYEFGPDVLLVTSGFFVTDETMDLARRRGTKVVLLHTESPYEDDRQVQRAAHADVNIINDPTNLALFPEGTYYQSHSYRPSLHHPQDAKPEWASDFCFVGTGYPSRVEFLEAVDWTGLDVALAGNWQNLREGSPLRPFVAHDPAQCLDNADTAVLYASSLLSANLYRREAEREDLGHGWAMGPREVELAAMGVPYLRDPRGEGDALLPMLPTFRTPGEFETQLRYLLANDAERVAAGEAARAAVADRTFTNAALRLLDHLN